MVFACFTCMGKNWPLAEACALRTVQRTCTFSRGATMSSLPMRVPSSRYSATSSMTGSSLGSVIDWKSMTDIILEGGSATVVEPFSQKMVHCRNI